MEQVGQTGGSDSVDAGAASFGVVLGLRGEVISVINWRDEKNVRSSSASYCIAHV
jgi:hypothetical protein